MPLSLAAISIRKLRMPSSTPPFGHAATSCVPVLAPDGAAARPTIPPARTSTSTVAFPRLSRILRIRSSSMAGIHDPTNRHRNEPGLEFLDGDVDRALPGNAQEGRRAHRDLQRTRSDHPRVLESCIIQE